MNLLDDYIMLVGLNSIEHIPFTSHKKVLFRPVGAPRISRFSRYRVGFVCIDRSDNQPKYLETSLRHMKYLCDWSNTMGIAFYNQSGGDWQTDGTSLMYIKPNPLSPEEIEKVKSSFLYDLQETISTPSDMEHVTQLYNAWNSEIGKFVEAQENLYKKFNQQTAQKKEQPKQKQKSLEAQIENLKVSDDLKLVLKNLLTVAETSGW